MLLDPQLSAWVLYPILYIMFLVGLLKNYLSLLLLDTPNPEPLELRQQQWLLRGRNLIANHCALSKTGISQRRLFLIAKFRQGHALKDRETKDQKINPMSDPSGTQAMTTSLKGNIANMLPQTIVMTWVNYFFSGFVLFQLPFPLTYQFKSMLQTGIYTRDLDASWVSSISWYLLTLFGLKSFYNLLLDSDITPMDTGSPAASMANMMMPNMAPGEHPHKTFLADADSIALLDSKSVLDNVESRLLKRFMKI
ncbi:hypothetical protein CANCADRAFT_113951 [Tortispora caseinolytica NRRL Y-17796]|uniref:ER membrane protein complex subunit 3 n=1 Tax=Tortispora caseinolytica NRRL Y-17796 TaxID=767744 RepID=A0A1E4TGV3_9ASCO|nr:hypothetical protein CANCADRAFT_113951 [Tortispora caseinolytica NRRL Y-17796]